MSSSNEQLIASAYVFGAAALAFATLPFVFCVLRGLMKANEPNSTPGGVFNVFLFSFGVHIVACVAFMTAILILDNVSISKKNHLQNCVFQLFWADTKNIDSLLKGACGQKKEVDTTNPIYSGSVSILYVVQTVRDWLFILITPSVLFLGAAYGVSMMKKDTYKQNSDYTSVLFWTFGSSTVAYILFVLWAEIAEIALFMPFDKSGVLNEIVNLYRQKLIEPALMILEGKSSGVSI